MPILAFFLWFFLFVASASLTYLSLRAWLIPAPQRGREGLWREGLWPRALRTAGFLAVTLTALIGAVSDSGEGTGRFDVVSLLRISGYVLLLVSTPPRLRRQSIVALAFALQLLGEALILLHASGTLPSGPPSLAGPPVLLLLSTMLMDLGIALLWQRYTRTVLRARLTDKFTLAFATFGLLLVLLATISVVVVVRATLQDNPGMQSAAFQSLNRPLIALFVAVAVGSAIVSFFVARGLTAPVNRMGAALRAIGRSEFDYRLRGIRSRDEIQGLAQEINQMARRLQEADALRTEFVSFASHELRNPLTAIQGFIQLLQDADGPAGQPGGIAPEQRAEIYGILRGECARLLRMTNELLDTSRIEAGRPMALNMQTVDVRRVAVKVVDVMRAYASGHTLSVHAPDKPLLLEADGDKLEQILINLLSNAIKYSPAGGPIEVMVQDRAVTIEIAVRDQGMGMTAEQAARVFDKYYRIGDSRADGKSALEAQKALGTGLGLYLTRALVQAHGGTIRVDSAPEQGSTFTVALPKKQTAPGDSNAETTLPLPENNGAPVASGVPNTEVLG